MKYFNFPKENSPKKSLINHNNKSLGQELSQLLGISSRTIVLGTELANKKIIKSSKRPITGRCEGLIKDRDKFLHKNTFFDYQHYGDGLCFVHKLRKIGNTLRISRSPQRKNEKDCQTQPENVKIFKTSKNINPVTLDVNQKYDRRRNQSQQTLMPEFFHENYESSEFQHSPANKNFFRSIEVKKANKKKILKQMKNASNNITAWENDILNEL